MEKQITITLPESTARILMHEAYNKMSELDLLLERKRLDKKVFSKKDSEDQDESYVLERMKKTIDAMEEVFETLRAKIHH